jgi:hypothetical protein
MKYSDILLKKKIMLLIRDSWFEENIRLTIEAPTSICKNHVWDKHSQNGTCVLLV